MKKILLLSVLVSSICLGEDSYAEHEAKMQQMQERSMNQEKQGSGEKKQNRYGKCRKIKSARWYWEQV